MLKRYDLRNYRFFLVLAVLMITVLGILLIGSANKDYQNQQIMGMALGVTAMLVLSLIDYTWMLKLYWLIYLFNLGLLILVKIPGVGVTVKGATRWIEYGGFRFQPSELSKLLLILFFAKLFEKHKEHLNTVRILLLTGILLGIPLLLIKSQPDLSTTISVAVNIMIMIYVAGLSYKLIGAVAAVGVPSVIVFLYLIFQPDQQILDTYQLRRIMAWLQPALYADDAYQQQNSMMAIGSGQLTGKGLNNNLVSSVKNGGFVAEPQTDFIFAIAGEELGFVGCVTIIVLLGIIVLECIWIGRKARDFSGTLICCGIAGYIAFQTFINICVATGLMPNTGIPLPFVSYGLTSLVTLYLSIGIVLNIGLQPKKY